MAPLVSDGNKSVHNKRNISVKDLDEAHESQLEINESVTSMRKNFADEDDEFEPVVITKRVKPRPQSKRENVSELKAS